MKLAGKSANQPRCWAVWVTSDADRTEHAVTEEQLTAGRAGVYIAQCGLQFAAASMVTPALRRCTDCLLTPAPTHRAAPPRDGLLALWTSRLLRLLWTPVAGSPHPEGCGPASRPDGSHGPSAARPRRDPRSRRGVVIDGVGAGPVLAVRQQAAEVHLAVLPARSAAGPLTTLCGALLAREQIEAADVGSGMPCSMCLILRAATEKPMAPVGELPPAGPTPAHRRASPEGYAALGWPVTIRGDQILLTLDGEVTALILPTTLAEQTMQVLIAQARPAPVLAHPDAPEHRIVIAGEPYGIPLPWPGEVDVTTGQLPLPPTVTPRGAVTWTHLPDGHPLTFCREIDLIGAVHTARHSLAPS